MSQKTSKAFRSWMLAMFDLNVDYARAAKELGITPRMARHYADGTYPVPRKIALACAALLDKPERRVTK